jgi:CheY-specific phosphatase CheX
MTSRQSEAREARIGEVFVAALRDTLGTMAMFDLEIEAASPSAAEKGAEILARIELRELGWLTLGLTFDLARQLVASMLGLDPDAVGTEEFADGSGELANMVAGFAKAVLADDEIHFTLGLPQVELFPTDAPPPQRLLFSGTAAGLPIWLGIALT